MSVDKEGRCPGCGRKYRKEGKSICYICEECPSCCTCIVPVIMTTKQFETENEKALEEYKEDEVS